jgi:hypothetical protein
LWCDDRANRAELAEILSQRDYLNLPAAMLAQSLAGEIPGVRSRPEDFLCFGSDGAGRPRIEEALWLFAQMRRWGQLPDAPELEAAVRAVFRPDLFDAAVGESAPPQSITACDGIQFDGSSVSDYLGRFELSTPFVFARDASA